MDDARLNREEFERQLKNWSRNLEAWLLEKVRHLEGTPERLREAMLYSLEAGGKRIRPVLCMLFASINGMDIAKVMPFAAGIEMIHTYSLIHDDLPAMDDDDLRRGKPSSHVAFDEATAILAGDGLLTDAFWFMSQTEASPALVLEAVARFAKAAGSPGMVGGQMLDMIFTGKKNVTFAEIAHMQALKTGAILEASCVCGAILAGADEAGTRAAAEYGGAFGRAFQIIDDILDITGDPAVMGKPAGSDETEGKNTCPSAIGVAKSRELALSEIDRALKAISGLTAPETPMLRNLALYICERAK